MSTNRLHNAGQRAGQPSALSGAGARRPVLALLASLLSLATLFVLLPARPITSRWSGPPGGAPVAREIPFSPGAVAVAQAQPREAAPATAIVGQATARAAGKLGLQYGAVVDDHGQIVLQDEALRLIERSGAGWIKINFRLGGFADWTETTTFGYSALSRYDQIVASAHAHNLQVLGELSNESWHGIAPHWQGNSAEAAGGNGDNQYIRDFARNAAVVLARHYAGRIDAWEIWNEPSQAATYMYPSNFAQLLAQVYAGARAAGVTSARFVSGGITSIQDEAGRITPASSGADYLREVYAQGRRVAGWAAIEERYGTYPLDAIGQHIYLDGAGLTSAENVGAALRLLRDAYVEGEGGGTVKQTVITELGWATDHVAELDQAANLRTAYAAFQQTDYVQRAFWFFLRDEPGPGLYFGLLNPDSSEKPAWQAFREYAAN